MKKAATWSPTPKDIAQAKEEALAYIARHSEDEAIVTAAVRKFYGESFPVEVTF